MSHELAKFAHEVFEAFLNLSDAYSAVCSLEKLVQRVLGGPSRCPLLDLSDLDKSEAMSVEISSAAQEATARYLKSNRLALSCSLYTYSLRNFVF